MFSGPARLMRRNPQVMWVFWGGVAACLVAVAVLMVIPGKTAKGITIGVLTAGMLAVYPRLLSRGFKPVFTPVSLYVDQSGVYADDAPLALRENIAQAYIRPAIAERTQRYRNSGANFSVTLPSAPLTVELILRRGGQVNIDPGGPGEAADILTALGFPVTEQAVYYRPKTTGRQWALTALVVVLFLAALFGFSFYKSTGH